ncbi:MAG: rhodanese-like domain-containing protein [Chthoniobacteraceae bacterium]
MTSRPSITIRLLFADACWLAVTGTVALAAGVAGDQLLRATPLGLQYRTVAELAVQASEIRFVGIEELEELLGRPEVVTIDARPREIFELGHIPGARSLPRERFPADFAEMEAILRVPGQIIVVYCADVTCPDGAILARSLQERGFSKLVVFEGGYDEWEASGRPVETAL